MVTDDDLNKLYDWACNEDDNGRTRYAGMTYEDGIKAVIDFIQGNVDIKELMDED